MRRLAFLAVLAMADPVAAQDAYDHGEASAEGSSPAAPATVPGDTQMPRDGSPRGDAAPEDHAHHLAPATEGDAAAGKGRLLYYKNPMGQPDTSPVPKKDSMGMDYLPVYESDVPPTITDHAADRFYDPAAMAAARSLVKHEHGGEPISLVSLNILELQARDGKDGYRWDGEAWYGSDAHRALVKFKGEGEFNGAVENAEIQALYAHPVGPYFNLEAGVRYDVTPHPSRGYATLGFEGLAPYWFEVGGALFVSNKGDIHARVEGYYDLNLTQRLVLQPRAEVNLAAQNVPELKTGAGISNIEAELRLRYEIRREFAPYIGVTLERKVGRTADLTRAVGESVSATSFVAGVKLFF